MRRTRFSQDPAITIRHRRMDKEYRFFVFSDILLQVSRVLLLLLLDWTFTNGACTVVYFAMTQCKVHGHLSKETELVRCIRLGGRRDQIELLEEENGKLYCISYTMPCDRAQNTYDCFTIEVRIVDEDAIIYLTGLESEVSVFG